MSNLCFEHEQFRVKLAMLCMPVVGAGLYVCVPCVSLLAHCSFHCAMQGSPPRWQYSELWTHLFEPPQNLSKSKTSVFSREFLDGWDQDGALIELMCLLFSRKCV